MKRCDMSGTNTIELYDKESDLIIPLRLYRVMSIGHLDMPNKAAKYKATLRACQPQEQRRDPTKRATFEEYQAIIPDSFKDAIFDAFNNDQYVLAQISDGCLTALVTLSKPFSFDLNSYKIEHGQPIKAMDSSL